jgi:hypothetical protein
MNCVTDCDKALAITPNLVKALKKKAQALAHMLKFS